MVRIEYKRMVNLAINKIRLQRSLVNMFIHLNLVISNGVILRGLLGSW